MIVKKEKYYVKIVDRTLYETQRRKRTSFLLFGIIPLYIKDEVLSGSYEH